MLTSCSHCTFSSLIVGRRSSSVKSAGTRNSVKSQRNGIPCVLNYHRHPYVFTHPVRKAASLEIAPEAYFWEGLKGQTMQNSCPPATLHKASRRMNQILLSMEGASMASPPTESGSSMVVKDPRRVRFCSQCGHPTVYQIPRGDERGRDVCLARECERVHYANPNIVVGAVCLWEGKVLLCKRAIEPCEGKWGIPQGYMELGESAREGAAREAHEEAGVDIEPGRLLAVYNVPAQVQLLYLSQMRTSAMSAGIESRQVGLFTWDEALQMDLAFPTVRWALEYARTTLGKRHFLPQERTKILGQGGPSMGHFINELEGL